MTGKRREQTMPEVNISQFLATRIRKAGEGLHTACEKMPEDKITWHPKTSEGVGRDALDQLLECAYFNGWYARALNTRTQPAFESSDYKAQTEAHANKTAALRWFQQETNALADAVAAFPASSLGDTIQDPLHNTQTTWADFAVDLLYWNTVYHEGQVNYIQVLYGDMS
jgi:hypothetical protein